MKVEVGLANWKHCVTDHNCLGLAFKEVLMCFAKGLGEEVRWSARWAAHQQ